MKLATFILSAVLTALLSHAIGTLAAVALVAFFMLLYWTKVHLLLLLSIGSIFTKAEL